MKQLISKAIKKSQKDGIGSLLREGSPWLLTKAYKKTPLYTPTPYYKRRSDNEQRWSIIEENLLHDHKNVLDIGCAEGFFTAKIANSGRFSIGIDTNADRLRHARGEWGNIENLGFMNLTLEPENIENIPTVDSILFLAVHRHWVREYGWENSKNMFHTLCKKSNILFYEPVGDRPLPETNQTLDPNDSIDHYTKFLNEAFDEKITILDVQMVPHYGDEINRQDPFFVLDTQSI